MRSPLERVQDLITLALDDSNNQEEARNAAIQAVKLIRKHDLLVMEVPIPRIRKTTEEFLAHKLKKLAEEKANQVVSDLVKKSILGEYPVVQASQIADELHVKGILTQDQRDIFCNQLRVCLLAKVRHGVLVSKSGWKKGYQLARRKK